MSVRSIALAIPLVLGIACSTSSTASRDHTGAMWTERSSGSGATSLPPAQAQQPQALASSESASQGGTGSAGDSGAGSSTATGSADAPGSNASPSGDTGSSSDQGQGSSSSDQGRMGSTSGSSGEAMGSREEGHGEDHTVTGKVSKVSGNSVSITSDQGETQTLTIVPETVVTVNGKAAKPSRIKQGRSVRASYAEQDGQEVAVKIEVGKAAAARSKGHMNGHHGMDHGGMEHGGSSGSSSGGSQ